MWSYFLLPENQMFPDVFRGYRKRPVALNKVRLTDPGDLNYLYKKSLWWRSFFENRISQWFTLAQAVKDSNSSSTKSTKATRDISYEIWDGYEYVRLETPEAKEGWGTKKHQRHEA